MNALTQNERNALTRAVPRTRRQQPRRRDEPCRRRLFSRRAYNVEGILVVPVGNGERAASG